MNPFQKIFTVLNKHRIKYLIAGGVAVNLYGYPRFTGDIDLLLTLDRQNLSKMIQVMKKLVYIQRLPIDLSEFEDKKKVKEWGIKKGLKAYTFVSDKAPQLDIDILVSQSLEFSKFYKKRKLIKVWNIKIPVISIDDLIRMKKKLSRPQDLLDVKALLQLK